MVSAAWTARLGTIRSRTRCRALPARTTRDRPSLARGPWPTPSSVPSVARATPPDRRSAPRVVRPSQRPAHQAWAAVRARSRGCRPGSRSGRSARAVGRSGCGPPCRRHRPHSRWARPPRRSPRCRLRRPSRLRRRSRLRRSPPRRRQRAPSPCRALQGPPPGPRPHHRPAGRHRRPSRGPGVPACRRHPMAGRRSLHPAGTSRPPPPAP
jgi:hypothetical protein